MLANIANCLAEIYIGIRTKNDTTLQGSFPLFFAKKIRRKKVLKAQKRAQSLLKWRIEFRRSELYDKKLACHKEKGLYSSCKEETSLQVPLPNILVRKNHSSMVYKSTIIDFMYNLYTAFHCET